MQLVLKGKNFIVSDRIRDYVEKKIGKLDRYMPEIDETRVEITEEKTKSAKDRKVVQVTLRTDGTILRAEERGEAIYACIDAVAEKIYRQIVRYKGKRTNRWQGQANKRKELGLMPELDQEVIAALTEENERKIVRTKRFTALPMSQDEAVEQMELLGHDFFVFYNAEIGRINVLYRRADNNYGLQIGRAHV